MLTIIFKSVAGSRLAGPELGVSEETLGGWVGKEHVRKRREKGLDGGGGGGTRIQKARDCFSH